MPKPTRAGLRYLPGLDGVRALAVLAVIAYHEQLGWAIGGLLGVGVFFTLSGYLITGILLAQWSGEGRVRLRDFWLGRARRLLPALLVMLAVVTAWATFLDRARLSSLRGALAAAITYSSNWYLIAAHQSYFSRFAPPAPLDHLWSLAVEEQFYLVWPSLLIAALFLVRKRSKRVVAWLALPTLALAAGSAVAMLLLYHPGLDPTRVYEGTDTRAFGLLIGAALAMVSARRTAEPSRAGRLLLDAAGIAGLAVIGLMFWRVGQFSPFAYRGGLVLLSIAAAAVVAAVACPGSVVGRALGWAPLRWIGERSYGIYLWHYPVIVLTSPANTGEDLPRAAAQVAATIALAALSWQFIEQPVRHGALGRFRDRVRESGWRSMPIRPGALAGLGGAAALLLVAGAGLAEPGPAPAGNSAVLSAGSSKTYTSQSVAGSPGSGSAGSAGSGSAGSGSGKVVDGRPAAKRGQRPEFAGVAPSPSASPAAPLRTSCRAVAHIGDSTSDGLVSPDYLPNPAQRIPEQYEDVGVRSVRTNIVGARSVAETLPGTTNGYDAAKSIVSQGFRGCWVIALGTDDTADVAAGSEIGLMTRVRRMMSVADGGPVMWVNVKSLLDTGPYAESNMLRWDRTLLQACARYPNLRVFNWAALAKTKWFISDGIHYTSKGYAARSRDIAQALARAFPRVGHSSGCVVS